MEMPPFVSGDLRMYGKANMNMAARLDGTRICTVGMNTLASGRPT
jgi:hypothetical protein